jgi:hypothetical protein
MARKTPPSVTAFDGGSGYTKVKNSMGWSLTYPSCYALLSPSQLRQKRPLNEDSPTIVFDGKTYLVGSGAIELNGSNNWSGDKLKNILLGVCAAHRNSQRLDQLLICVPDSSMDLPFTELAGIHHYSINGRDIQLEICDVEAIDETYGVWLGARELFLYPDGINGTLTIGALTVNYDRRNGSGLPLSRKVNTELGMLSIATKISNDLKAIHNLSDNPPVAQIMNGMAIKNYRLPSTNINFESVLLDRIGEWKDHLKRWIAEANADGIKPWQYAIAGAGAEYLRPAKEVILPPDKVQNFIVCQDPQMFAINALMRLHEN